MRQMMDGNAGEQMLGRVHHSRLRIGFSRVSRLRAHDVAFGFGFGFGSGFGVGVGVGVRFGFGPVVDSGRAGW